MATILKQMPTTTATPDKYKNHKNSETQKQQKRPQDARNKIASMNCATTMRKQAADGDIRN